MGGNRCRGRGQGQRGRRGQGRGRGQRGYLAPEIGTGGETTPTAGLSGPPSTTGTTAGPGADELTAMKQCAEKMERELANLRSRLTQAGVKANQRVAVIDRAACSLCGACASSCPRNAIRLTDVAEVDTATCTGCGACVRVCPTDAIRLEVAD